MQTKGGVMLHNVSFIGGFNNVSSASGHAVARGRRAGVRQERRLDLTASP